MEQVEKKSISLRDLSLKQSFMLYMVVFTLIALFCSISIQAVFTNTEKNIIYRKIPDKEQLEYSTSYGVHTKEGKYYEYTPREARMIRICNIGGGISLILSFLVIVIMAGLLFYRNKLKTPITLLEEAASKIGQQDLDFHIYYNCNNEMGRLCRNFEQMRSSLDQNNREMWRAMEERKRLNAAFSHDLRTPLTVLRGYVDMLSKYLPDDKVSKEKLIGTVQTMSAHVTRLENYVSSMHALQKLEDVDIKTSVINCEEFAEQIRDCADILCREKGMQLKFTTHFKCSKISVDRELVMQVFENLISNGVRYAKRELDVQLFAYGEYFSVAVGDDGKGFTREALEQAVKPFYKEKENVYDSHFGLGLNICKILSEKHGGSIFCANGHNGGGLVQANFKMLL